MLKPAPLMPIKSLRKKLGAWGIAHIETIRGLGYKIKTE